MEGEKKKVSFQDELQNVLLKSDLTKLEDAGAAIGGKYLGIYFSAHWCPPCQQFTPILANFYNNLKAQRNDFEIIFVSSDKSAAEFKAYAATMPWLVLDYDRRDLKGSLGQAFNVTGIPTLIWLDPTGQVMSMEGRKRVMDDRMGANFPWNKKGEKMSEGEKAGGGLQGQNVGERKQVYSDVNGDIDMKKSSCLNSDPDTPFASVFSAEGGLVRSDADETMIFNIVFNQVIRLHSYQILGNGGHAPKAIKMYVNRGTLGFEDSDLPATETVELTQQQATDPKCAQVLTDFVKFQKVSSLSIFIESNQDDEEQTIIQRIKLTGAPFN